MSAPHLAAASPPAADPPADPAPHRSAASPPAADPAPHRSAVGPPADPVRPVLVRQAVPADRDALTRMFERCTLATRYHRFHGPVRAIPASYLAEALSNSPFHYALIATPGAPASFASSTTSASPASFASPARDVGETVALASCRLVAEGAAELGLLIEDGWQRHGLGTRLLHDLIAHAAGIGVRVVEAQLLAEQAWIAGLLRPYGAGRVHSARDGVMTVTVRLASRVNLPHAALTASDCRGASG